MPRLAAVLRVAVAVAAVVAAVIAGCSEAQHPAAFDAAVDTPIDTRPDPCLACRADQICVAMYDGTCGDRGASCVARTVDCPGNACSTACEAAYCPTPFRCSIRIPCGGEPPEAFTCYGP
jgi:hypothetical protein